MSTVWTANPYIDNAHPLYNMSAHGGSKGYVAMFDTVAVGIRVEPGRASSFVADIKGFQRSFLTEAFFDGDHRDFLRHLSGFPHSPGGHVPIGAGYILFDFVDLTIVSYQAAVSLHSIPRSVLADMFEQDPASAAAVARAITHRENTADGLGRRAVGPYGGSERSELSGYSNVHERFSTFFFDIPGWRTHWGVLSPEACSGVFKQIEARIRLSDAERAAWERLVSGAEAARNMSGSF